MIIRKYGILLRRLTEEDIELVRVHRNSADVRQFMFYQDIITPEMQKKWFNSINNIYNHYYIIEYKDRKIGMIFCKNDNYEERTTETGIFIWDKQYLNSFVPVLASIIFGDLGFNFTEMKKVFATVRQKNKQVINYVTEMGYRVYKEFPDEEKVTYSLTKDVFYSKTDKIRKAIIKITKDFKGLSEEDFDFSTVSDEERKKLYAGYPEYLQKKFDRIFKGKI